MTSVVYVGHDAREQQAYQVCKRSLQARAGGHVRVRPISYPLLGDLYRRPVERRMGVLYDVISDAPMSTEFSLARFFAPLLHERIGADSAWVVFCDCDFLWRAPVERLLAFADDRYAVMVVKHTQRPVETRKMDGQPQTAYERKNWSSLMLLNCALINHATFGADGAGVLAMLNGATGLDLQQLRWCPDELIGELPLEWNWLAGVSPHVDNPQAVHFTLGTPDLPGYEDYPYANEWRRYL